MSFFCDGCWAGTFSSLFFGVLAKRLEPAMLSGKATIVKTAPARRAPEGGWRVMVTLSREANFLPDTELLFTGSLADPVTQF